MSQLYEMKNRLIEFVAVYQLDEMPTCAADYAGIKERAINKYLHDSLFHAKVETVVYNVLNIMKPAIDALFMAEDIADGWESLAKENRDSIIKAAQEITRTENK